MYAKKVTFKGLVIVALILSMPLLRIFNIPLIDYFDEIIGIFSFVYITIRFFTKKLAHSEKIVFIIIVLLSLIGFLSNYVYGIITSIWVIVFDWVEFTKCLAVIIAFRNLFKQSDVMAACNYLNPIAKVLMFFAFLCSVISQFVDIGMTVKREYGINSFGFIYGNAIQTYFLLTGCMIILFYTLRKKKEKNIYIFMYCVTCFFTTAIIVWCSIAFLFFFKIYYEKKKQLKIKTLIAVGILSIIIAFYEIEKYLMNTEAPRAVLLVYGIKTANRFFPLGAGFGSYGGEMAARYYSPLYWEYGFNDRYGLSHTGYGGILNDNYIAMIMAQFGYVGLMLFGTAYYKLFKCLDIKNNCK
ncbi:MAG: hypothetical protein IKP88_12110 [Lachnospiraceae bacterium]|nr:hypothetical protein [Lachnospiraceae bacterium]